MTPRPSRPPGPVGPCRLVIGGATGRTGSRVAALARADSRFVVALAASRAEEALLPEALAGADALIDFSVPESAVLHAEAAARRAKPAVIGVTGFSPLQTRRLKALSRRAPILVSPNMSPGANLLISLAPLAAAALPGYSASIRETHHRLKRDKPSGTALRLAEAAGRRVPITSRRVGDVVGEHTLILAGPGEILEMGHRARSRDVFAVGALRAALWLGTRGPGWYSMADVLGLS